MPEPSAGAGVPGDDPAGLPPPVDLSALPAGLRSALRPHERVYFAAQPVRPALGRGLWWILGLGVLFCATGVAATADVLARAADPAPAGPLTTIGVGAAIGLAGVFLLFALALLLWPWVVLHRLRRTWVLITEDRVVSFRLGSSQTLRQQKSHPLSECRDASVARRRGASASLVLREGLRERATDGQTVYEWEAIHGLPRADEALRIVMLLRDGAPRASLAKSSLQGPGAIGA